MFIKLIKHYCVYIFIISIIMEKRVNIKIETYISDTFNKELTNMIYRCLDKRKTQMDSLITKNELDGLTYILNSLTNAKNNIH